MDEVETLAEQRVRAARQVKRLILTRDRAASNIFELESLETNPERREELLGMAETFARMLDSELREARLRLEAAEEVLEIAREQRAIRR